jgi:quercetin dioxygenase-like cupin family protein/DNA-binding XRE family transcriptional regulator
LDANSLQAISTEANDLTKSVGRAIKRQRQIANFTMRKLSKISGVSAAMISRIESGQVSASLTTLDALANALSLSVVTLFADTVSALDVMFVKGGSGIPATRNMPFHTHVYRVLGTHRKDPLSFEAVSVTVERKADNAHPQYINRGFLFVTVTDGECLFQCGEKEFHMCVGDSVSLDAELVHGIKEVITKSMTCNMVSAKII